MLVRSEGVEEMSVGDVLDGMKVTTAFVASANYVVYY